MVIALFLSIWAGAENIKMCRPPMCGGLTWALCIFYRQRLGLGEFCLIADCHRKLTWGSRHEFHIIFLASSNSGASRKKNSFPRKLGVFPPSENRSCVRAHGRSWSSYPPNVRGPLDRLIRIWKGNLRWFGKIFNRGSLGSV